MVVRSWPSWRGRHTSLAVRNGMLAVVAPLAGGANWQAGGGRDPCSLGFPEKLSDLTKLKTMFKLSCLTKFFNLVISLSYFTRFWGMSDDLSECPYHLCGTICVRIPLCFRTRKPNEV